MSVRSLVVTVFSMASEIIIASENKLPEIELVPETILMGRSRGAFKEITWSADSPWFSKPAPVCKVVEGKWDFAKLRKAAEEMNMVKVYGGGPRDPFRYKLPTSDPFTKTASGEPRIGKFSFRIARYRGYNRDEHLHPIVEPLPKRDECVVIAREWMAKLGIDENALDRTDKGPGGLNLTYRVDLILANHPDTREPVEYEYGATLIFAQQIGGLPVLWHGFGGAVTCEIGDGGEFCSLYGTLSAWEKIGDYPVLNREEITQALHDRFFWVTAAFQCEKVEITDVHLEAYHVRDDETQKHFPLIYTLSCKLHGGPDNGYTVGIRIPALRQHRDKYGPPPPPWTGGAVSIETKPAAVLAEEPAVPEREVPVGK